MVDFERSASHTTTSLFSRPSSTSARPKASRVAHPSFSSNFGFVWHRHYCISCRASFTSSCVGATPWYLGLFSMNETPLPLMVWAIIAVGLPLVAAASANAPCNRGNVVPVDLDGVPSECPPFVGQRFDDP